jgi:hypothetical protein
MRLSQRPYVRIATIDSRTEGRNAKDTMKALVKYAGLLVLNFFTMMWGVYRLSDGVFTGIEFLQTILVLINFAGVAYFYMLLFITWKAYRKKP